MYLGRLAILILLTFSMPALAEIGMRHTARYPDRTAVRAMAYSPNSQELAITVGKKVEFFDMTTGEKKREHPSRPFALQYTKDGKHIAMISEKETKVLDTTLGTAIGVKLRRIDRGYIGVNLKAVNGKAIAVSVSPGGPAGRSGKIKQGDEIIAISKDRHSSFLSPVVGKNGVRAIAALAGDAGKYVRLKVLPSNKFDIEDAVVHEFRREAVTVQGTEMTFNPLPDVKIEENIVWCLSDGYHDFRSASSGQTIAHIQTEQISNIGQHAISPDQKRFAVLAKQRKAGGYAVEIFNLETQQREAMIPYPGGSYFVMHFDATGNRLLVGADGAIEIADLGTEKFGNQLATNRNVRALASSSKGGIATITYEGKIELWDGHTGTLLSEIPAGKPKHYGGDGQHILFSPDGKWLSFYIGFMLHMVDVSGVGAETPGENLSVAAETTSNAE